MKITTILALIALGAFSIDFAYAQDSNVIESVEYVVVIATVLGAVVSVYDGYNNAPENEKFSRKKLLSALIKAVSMSLLAINFNILADQVSGLSFLAICILFFGFGFGADKGFSKLGKTD